MRSRRTQQEVASHSLRHEIVETPPALVEGGRIHSGFFSEPFRRVNLMDAGILGGERGRGLRWLRLKEWIGFGVNHPELFGGIIIQDAKYAVSATVYLYDRKTGRMHDWLIMGAPFSGKMPESLWDSRVRVKHGKSSLSFRHELERHAHRIQAKIPANRRQPALEIDLVLSQPLDRVQPLVFSLPIAAEHHTYTHKSPLYPQGQIRIGEQAYRFEPERDLVNLDEQKTFYPYRSRWKWGCFGQRTQAGHELMLNVVEQMTPDDLPGEDCLWVNGRLELLRPPEITESATPGHYTIRTPDGRVALDFEADGAKSERLNFGLIAMDYAQHFGRFNGEITDAGGTRHAIVDAYGALEHMRARF